MTGLLVTVIGEPASQGSKTRMPNGAMIESSKKTKPWRTKVTAAALEARDKTRTPTMLGPVRIRVRFVFARPQSHWRTGRFADQLKDDAATWKTSTPDIDKATRAILDALADAGVFRNDAQVCSLYATKTYSDPESLYPAFCSIEISEPPMPYARPVQTVPAQEALL